MATAARAIEALRIEWKDIDFARKTIAINKPAKHGRTRTIQLKGRFVKVIDILSELKNRQINIDTCRNRKQRNLNIVFTYSNVDAAGQNFRRAREAAAKRLGMPQTSFPIHAREQPEYNRLLYLLQNRIIFFVIDTV